MQFTPRYVITHPFALLLSLMLLGLTNSHAQAQAQANGPWTDPWITKVTGISKGQEVSGTVYIETHVKDLDEDADYDLRYEVEGPSGFIYTARSLPFKLKGDAGWDTTQATPGEYLLNAYLVRNHRIIAFRRINFTVVESPDQTRITDVQGVEEGQHLTEPTSVRVFVEGATPTRVTFNLNGPAHLWHAERYDPYFMLGDHNVWQVDEYPEGAYALTITTYLDDNATDTHTINFHIGEGTEDPIVPLPTPIDPPAVVDGDPDTGPLPDGYDRGFLGMNLAEVNYYSREWAFVDVMKFARPWLPTSAGSATPWDSGQTLKLNSDGYPILSAGQAAHTHMFIDSNGAYPAGRYVCTFDGDGDIAFDWDARAVSRSSNRIEVDVDPTNQGIYVRINRSNPNNPVRNLRLWMPGFENADSSFHPLYIERLKPFSVIRFMDWMRTNTSDIVTWSQRPKHTYYSQGVGDGVALEYMIELCNELGADPWFCMPHLADDNYVRQFAQQVKQSLRPDLNVYVEWSNEVWNSQFPQHKWVQEVTNSDSLSLPFRQRWAREADRDFDIWRSVFADQSDRVIRLAVGQKDNPWVTEQLAKEMDGQFDAISCSTYFGITREQMPQLSASTTADQILDWALHEMSRSLRRNYQAHGQLARGWSDTLNRNIPLIGYEGGQHYTADGGSPPWAKALLEAQRHPKMYQAYLANLEEWKNAGGSLFTAFNFIDIPDKWGAWGQLEYMDQNIQDAPKYRALLEYNPN